MNKIGKVATAYIIASFVAIPTGWVISLILSWALDNDIVPWLVIALIWLLVVGVPSLAAASTYLLKLLGVTHSPWPKLQKTNPRLIPVGAGSNFAYSVSAELLTPTTTQQQLELSELQIIIGNYSISERVLKAFLNVAWQRQLNNKPGLSRNWWVEQGGKLDRGEYDAIIRVLQRHNLIFGRASGRSGKLQKNPDNILATLEELTIN